jgi:hypothetical protein
MTDEPALDLTVVLETAGKSVRMSGSRKWRRAITLRDLQRQTIVGLEVDGVPRGERPAGEIDALRGLFDELDPIPPETPPAKTLDAEAAGNDDEHVATPENGEAADDQPPLGSAASAAASAKAHGSAAVGMSTTPRPILSVQPVPTAQRVWFWFGLIGLIVVIAAILGLGMLKPVPAPIKPPFGITDYPVPVREQVGSPGLNLRSGPGAAYSKTEQALQHDDPVTAYGETTSADGGKWQYVEAKDGVRGYVNRRLLVPAAP